MKIPEAGTRWLNTNGGIYTVIIITNIGASNPEKYPITIVYTLCNNQFWSRPLSDWHRSMTEVT